MKGSSGAEVMIMPGGWKLSVSGGAEVEGNLGEGVRGIVLEEVGEVVGGGGGGGVDMVVVVCGVDKGRCALCDCCKALCSL